jgi:hypothetical protein
MLKIIKTQNGDLVNFANIVEIHLAEGEGTNESKETVTMFALVANDTAGKEHELGIFDTQTQLEKVLEMLEFFLALSVETMFEIPLEIDEGDNNA